MNLLVKHFQDVPYDKWDNFVYNNSMGYSYFLSSVISIDRFVQFEHISFAIIDSDKDDIYMIVQLHKETLPYITEKEHCNLHSRWGFVLKDNLENYQTKKVRKTFIDYMDRLYDKLDVNTCKFNLPPLSEYMQPGNCPLINPLIHFACSPGIRYTYIVDLSKTKEQLLANCEQTTRQAIRKISKENYTVLEAQSTQEDFDCYISLHKETYERTGAANAVIDDSYHRNMFFNLIPQKICRVFFLKDLDSDRVIASVAILLYKNTGYYWWGASRDTKEVGINKYLLFQAMLAIRPKNIEETGEKFYFETGAAYPHLRKSKNKGLNDFKKCFGTILYPIYQGTFRNIQEPLGKRLS